MDPSSFVVAPQTTPSAQAPAELRVQVGVRLLTDGLTRNGE